MAKQPLYQQIYNQLKEDILTNQLKENDQLPTELELSESYQVSRITSKRALGELENEGLIYRIRGKGSFVKAHQPVIPNSEQLNLLFIMPFPHNAGFGDYTQGMMDYLATTDYRLKVQPHQFLSNTEIAELAAEYAGIIYYPTDNRSNLELLFGLHLNNIPTVLLDKEFDSLPFTTIVSDNQAGGCEATSHLLKGGRQKVAFISTESIAEISSVRERYFGYLKGLHEGTKQSPCHVQSQSDEDTSAFLARAITDFKANNITGIVAENDILAIKLINAMKQQGYEVPKDFAVVGFDNIQAASLLEPSLTTIAQDFNQMGELAARHLLNQLTEKNKTIEKVVVPVKFIKRSSS